METQETGIPEAGTATYNTAFTSFRLPPNNRKRQRLLRPSPFPAEDDRAEDEAAKAECTALHNRTASVGHSAAVAGGEQAAGPAS